VTKPEAEETARIEAMVRDQIEARGVSDPRVLEAMRRVRRSLFVPEALRTHAYADEPLPIGDGQTISQPYIVAFMTEALGLRGASRVLEIGTGSGYQTAVLAELAAEVFSIEIVAGLAVRARRLLDELGCRNVRFRTGNGASGWPEKAPFDAIIATAAPASVPPAWPAQLAPDGVLVLPVGVGSQSLIRVVRGGAGWRQEHLLNVRFVPLTGGPQGETS
jgi:protein-L-isoaspartate(D-aspartate) O-methyltransferase